MSATIKYNNVETQVNSGKTATLNCKDKMMKTNVEVSYSNAGGSIIYNNITKELLAGQKATFYCADCLANSNFVITAYAETEIETAGLYDSNGNIVADWEQLISDGMDVVNTAYNANTALTNQASPYNVLSKYGNGKKLIISDSVTFLNQFSFYKCDTLTSVIIPDSVKSMGVSVFRNCDNLTSVTIGNSVTTINNFTFGNCISLTSVTIGNSVDTINPNSFNGCSSLTSITIPDSVTSIGDRAFYNCSSLTSVTIKATTPPTLSSATIFPTKNTGFKIYVPKGYGDVYKNQELTNWPALVSYIKEED